MNATPPGDVPLLELRDLAVHYGDLVGVASVSLLVQQGEVVTLLGSNGAGKTSTLNAVAGLAKPASGQVLWRGAPIGGLLPHAIVGRGIALSPEGWLLFVKQTVEQNLRLGATALAERSRLGNLLERVFELFPKLRERRRQLAGTLSGGERQMLAVGRALMSDPSLLLLDEPSLGLAPAVVESLYESLAVLRNEGLTLLIAEQSVELALEIADRGYVIQTGRTVLQGTAAELSRNEDVRRAYLGL